MPKRILIVDDFAPIRKQIRSFLESQTDFEVCGEAVDGIDAIEKAKALSPDLIILDFQMPRMNGMEAARVLQNMLPGAQVILFTMYGAVLSASDVAASGIKAVLSKTDHLNVLAGHARRLLG